MVIVRPHTTHSAKFSQAKTLAQKISARSPVDPFRGRPGGKRSTGACLQARLLAVRAAPAMAGHFCSLFTAARFQLRWICCSGASVARFDFAHLRCCNSCCCSGGSHCCVPNWGYGTPSKWTTWLINGGY